MFICDKETIKFFMGHIIRYTSGGIFNPLQTPLSQTFHSQRAHGSSFLLYN